MLKLIGQTEHGPAVTLVLVEANLVRLRAGQPIEITIGLEIQNVNGGRRPTFLHFSLAYAPTHVDGVAALHASGVITVQMIDELAKLALVADEKGADVADHTVEAFDA